MLHNVSNRHVLLAVLFILGSRMLFSQVKIKERVEIKPKPLGQAAVAQEAVLFADDPNPGGPAHVLVMHPCSVTATATIEMQGSPSSDLYVKTLVGGSIAWYNGHNVSPPQIGSSPVTFRIGCGSIPITFQSTWEGIDIRSTTKTIGSNNATFVFQGMLSRCSYTVTVEFQATYDNSYDLATMDLTADGTALTQCATTTLVHFKARNYSGNVYNGLSCTGQVAHKISVESSRDVWFDYAGNWVKQVEYAWGFEDTRIAWFYSGETEPSTATFTWQIGDQIKTMTFDLVLAPEQLKLTFGKDEIGYGESTTVRVDVVNRDGTLSPVPPGWLVWFETMAGSDQGFLYSLDSTEVSDRIVSTSPEVKFYSLPQAYPPNSTLVPIGVMTFKDGGGIVASTKALGKSDILTKSSLLPKNVFAEKMKSLASSGGSLLQMLSTSATAVEPCQGIYLIDTLVVKKKAQLDHFEVSAIPDTLVHSDTSVIKVIPKDKGDKNVLIVDTTELNFLLSISGQKYGRLISPSAKGPTVNVTYAETKEGKLMYVADGEYAVGDSAQQVEVSVVKGDDESRSGNGKIYIKPTIEQFCQSDGRWARTQYDRYVWQKKVKGGDSTDAQGNKVYYCIKDKGCALTCMAMIAKAGGADIDPGKFAEYMNDPKHYSFTADHGVIWNTVDSVSGTDGFGFESAGGGGLTYKKENGIRKVDLAKSIPIDLSTIDAYLSNDALIVAQVYNQSTGNQHFVVITEKQGNTYKILDPGCYAGRNDLTAYSKNLYKFIVYQRN